MTEGSVESWLNDTNQAYDIAKKIGDKTIIISTLTGGSLASWLKAIKRHRKSRN